MQPEDTSLIGRLLSQWHDLAVFAFVSLAFGFVKSVLQPPSQNRSMKMTIVLTFLSVFIGTLTGAICLQAGSSDYLAIAASSLASLLSRDIVSAIIRNSDQIGLLIKRAAINLVDKWTK